MDVNAIIRAAALGMGPPAAPEREPAEAEEGPRVYSSADGGRHSPGDLDPYYFSPTPETMNERIAAAAYGVGWPGW